MARIKNLIGDVFGELTVIDRTVTNTGRTAWVCRCSCGNGEDVIVRNIDLVDGRITCCKKCRNKPKDYTGMPFNEWTVIRMFNDKTKMLCRCSCGAEKEVDISSVIRGKSKSCGHGIIKYEQDITDKHFGRWHVIRKANSDKKDMWECECACGTKRNVYGTNLRSGKTKSCGCLHEENWFNDLTGMKFGRLTVLSRAENKGSNVMWLCRCECGNQKIIYGSSLKNGAVRSCGCLLKETAMHKGENTFIDITGKRFNHLTAIKRIYDDDKIGTRWLCQCDCGNTCIVLSQHLKNGHTKSCGCMQSHGEEAISRILNANNIDFVSQKTFDDCRFSGTNAMARFDFFVNNEYLIEYDGQQHFFYKNHGWDTEENYLNTKERDAVKNEYCKSHNIKLIRIPYTHLDSICLDDLDIHKSKFIYC